MRVTHVKDFKGGKFMAEAGKKPGAATAGAVIAIIFAAWAIIASLIGFGTAAVYRATGSAVGEILTIVFSIIGLAMGVLGVIGAILVLAGKKIGVLLTKLWAIERLVNYVVFVLTAILGTAGLASSASAMTSMSDTSISQGTIGAGIGIATAILGILPMAIPGLIVLILISLKPVKEYFSSQA
jgi:hypothetical protein